MKKIYVADDDKQICELLKSHLSSSGYDVKAFYNGKSLLEAFLVQPCDLIITDIMMPQMSGYDLTREIRKNEYRPHIYDIRKQR